MFINLLKNKCSQADFDDKYEITTQIGKSKNSEVFTGRRKIDNKIYAIKIHKNVTLLNLLRAPKLEKKFKS